MARTTEKKPTIADLLDEAAEGTRTVLKVDKYLDTLPPDIRERVLVHLHGKMPSRRIALVISDDPSTPFTISTSAVELWRSRQAAEGS